MGDDLTNLPNSIQTMGDLTNIIQTMDDLTNLPNIIQTMGDLINLRERFIENISFTLTITWGEKEEKNLHFTIFGLYVLT